MLSRIQLSTIAAACALVSLSCNAAEIEDVAATSAALTRSTNPPGGLSAVQVPQFVAVTFDDNFSSEGMAWATSFYRPLRNPSGSGKSATFDGAAVRTSFYHNSLYLDGTRAAWQAAVADGHETGDHTVNHPFGLSFDGSQWTPEVSNCRSALASGLGLSQGAIAGFRTPYLGYNDALFTVLRAQSPTFAYDTSIQGGWADGESGGNGPWPYTLDAGSADASTVLSKFGSGNARSVGAHAGLWEAPVTTLIVPPDSLATQYGFQPGLRQRVQTALAGKSVPSFYEASSGKVAGLDITMIVDGSMNKAEALATLKYTLDLHLAGNRAPIVFVAHTHVYASNYGAAANVQNVADRRAIIEEFVRYALSKPEVRMRPVADVLAWVKTPVALGGGTCTPSCGGRVCGGDGCGGTCGACGVGQTCTSAGQCQSTCTPSCSGRTCGGDGCGGSCGVCGVGQTCTSAGQCQGSGGGNCSAPAWSGASYAAGDVVTADCQVATVGTSCYGNVGKRFAWRCDNAGWCSQLRPGSNQGGWWSAWTSIASCP